MPRPPVLASALIDSGAAVNLINKTLVEELRMAILPCTPPLKITAIDSLLKLRVAVLYSKTLVFYITSSPTNPIILGFPWLRQHDPQLSWTHKELLRRCGQVLAQSYSSSLPHYDGGDPKRCYPEMKAMDEYIEEALAMAHIRPSTSPETAGFFFVEKKDGGLRPCIDYRGLNAINVRYPYPLLLVPAALEQLRGAKFFTKLDLHSAYNLIRILEGDEWKTAFHTTRGHYEYLVMPFVLTNTLAVFQSLNNEVFRDILDKFVIAYIDNILVYSTSFEEHVCHVRTVLTRLQRNHLYVKGEKCEFHCTEITFLGYVISQQGIEMDQTKVCAVTECPEPTAVRELQCFLGFAKFYRWFIRNYSSIAGLLMSLLKGKPRRLVWNEMAWETFVRLRTSFTMAPILHHPDPNLLFVVEVDASSSGIRAVLSHRQGTPGKLHPCALYYKKLAVAKAHYDVGNKELLLIKAALEEWHHWLEGAHHPFLVLTDHCNLEYLRDTKRLNLRQARQDTEEYVRSCPTCAQTCVSHQLLEGLLEPLPVPQRPWPHLSIDFLTDLPSSGGFTSMMVVIDHFSKMCKLVPMKGLPTAMQMAEVLFQHVFRNFGLPEDILSDTVYLLEVFL
ncbi:hypothetical protein QTP70_012833 [Hemibagrus guttatus]|uniref:ribonuclease H n=1 Tax=Hemibagrus guttatus TaxID=175788 RepID=A0AAE0RK25_9TELE|nr:hypothetical protein QTP70_012833 [Hemibagrus guttatus]